MPLNLTAAADDNGRRLDRILRKTLNGLPLSAIHRLLRKGAVLVNGNMATAAQRILMGQTISVDIDVSGLSGSVTAMAKTSVKRQLSETGGKNAINTNKPYEVELEILFERSGLLVLNKPAGIAVHGKDSLEDKVLSYLAPKLPPSLSFRPGPLHRLDKPSSGIIAFSTSLEGAQFFSELMRKHQIKKKYLAIVDGLIKTPVVWKDDLIRDHDKKKTLTTKALNKPGITSEKHENPKTALTRVYPLAYSSGCTLIMAEIETGRTHQIRAQAAEHGCPLLGDKKYGGGPFAGKRQNSDDWGLLLHAFSLSMPEVLIEAPLPNRFQKKIIELFGEDFFNSYAAIKKN